MTGVYIAGTGNFAEELIELARAARFDVVGLIEPIDPSRVGSVRHGLPVHALEHPPDPPGPAAIGVAGDRATLADRLGHAGWAGATIVHPTAFVSARAARPVRRQAAPRAGVRFAQLGQTVYDYWPGKSWNPSASTSA